MDSRKAVLSIACVTLLLAACKPATNVDSGNGASSSSDASSAAIESSSSSSSSSAAAISSAATSSATTQSKSSAAASLPTPPPPPPADTVRTIEITAENFAFTPSTIRVKKGEKVRVVVKGLSGVHGFAVPGMSINLSVKAGDSAVADLVTTTAGVFDFFCSIPCGSGHQNMRGAIIVEE